MRKLKQSCEKQAGIEFTNMEKGEEPFQGWKKRNRREKGVGGRQNEVGV
jgi:hypothetical protein